MLIKLPPEATLAGQVGPALAAPAAGDGFVPLTQARQIPVGSQLDTTHGVIALRSATTRAGVIQSGQFRSGLFQVLQSRSKNGLNNLRLIDDGRVCKTVSRKASIAGAPKLSKRDRGAVRTKDRSVRLSSKTIQDRANGWGITHQMSPLVARQLP